jgi:hypothetical protein
VGSTVQADPMLTVSNAEIVYDGVVQAVRDISMVVRRGAIVALLGSNGVGKTTCSRQFPARSIASTESSPRAACPTTASISQLFLPMLSLRAAWFQIPERTRPVCQPDGGGKPCHGRIYARPV